MGKPVCENAYEVRLTAVRRGETSPHYRMEIDRLEAVPSETQDVKHLWGVFKA